MREINAEDARAVLALVGEVVSLDPRGERLPDAEPAAWRAVGQRIAVKLDAAQEEADRGRS